MPGTGGLSVGTSGTFLRKERDGAPGWLGWASDSWFQLWSWYRGHGIEARLRLRAQCESA